MRTITPEQQTELDTLIGKTPVEQHDVIRAGMTTFLNIEERFDQTVFQALSTHFATFIMAKACKRRLLMPDVSPADRERYDTRVQSLNMQQQMITMLLSIMAEEDVIVDTANTIKEFIDAHHYHPVVVTIYTVVFPFDPATPDPSAAFSA